VLSHVDVIGHHLHSDNTDVIIAGNLFEYLFQPLGYLTNQEASAEFRNPNEVIWQAVAAV
jgi:hypothetical protein